MSLVRFKKDGKTLYGIKKGKLFYIWCYSNKEFAMKIDARLGDKCPYDENDRQMNWRKNLSKVYVSHRATD